MCVCVCECESDSLAMNCWLQMAWGGAERATGSAAHLSMACKLLPGRRVQLFRICSLANHGDRTHLYSVAAKGECRLRRNDLRAEAGHKEELCSWQAGPLLSKWVADSCLFVCSWSSKSDLDSWKDSSQGSTGLLWATQHTCHSQRHRLATCLQRSQAAQQALEQT